MCGDVSGLLNVSGDKGSGNGGSLGSFKSSLYCFVFDGFFACDTGGKGPDKSGLLQRVLTMHALWQQR